MKNFNENDSFFILSAPYKLFNSAFSLFVAYVCFSRFLVVLIFEFESMATLIIMPLVRCIAVLNCIIKLDIKI